MDKKRYSVRYARMNKDKCHKTGSAWMNQAEAKLVMKQAEANFDSHTPLPKTKK